MREGKGRKRKEKENDSEGRSRRERKGRIYASGLKPPNQKCWLRPCEGKKNIGVNVKNVKTLTVNIRAVLLRKALV